MSRPRPKPPGSPDVVAESAQAHAPGGGVSEVPVGARATVRVPASSANLGPGFDALGLALSLHDEVSAEVTAGGGLELDVTGEGAGVVPRDESHLVSRALVRGCAELYASLPGVRLVCRNAIPHGRGLGSSSAAIVAGLALARALVPGGTTRMCDDRLFELAADMEGHPDNVAAAVYGGLVIAYADDDEERGGIAETVERVPVSASPAARVRALSLDVVIPVVPVVLIPQAPVATRVARGILPSVVPHPDAAWNAGRAALLIAALTGRPDRLLAATSDRLHQDYRGSAMPESLALIRRLRRASLPSVLSGAGPTVLALVPAPRVEAVRALAPGGWRADALEVDREGVRITG